MEIKFSPSRYCIYTDLSIQVGLSSNARYDSALPTDSIFYRLGSSGLISFSDYVFLLTILSTSR